MEYTQLREMLSALCPLPGPSGFERPVALRAAELLRPLVDEVRIDRMGNLIGVRRCGVPGAKRVLLDAHLDEIGLIVIGAEEGFLRFRTIGGVDPRMLPDREVTILTDPPLFGVVACLPPHVQKAGDADKSVPIPDLFIDTGLSQEEATARIPAGTPCVFRDSCFPLGQRQMCGKSMDDRSCFVTLLRAAQLLQEKKLDVDLYILGSTREEVSYGGAATAVWTVAPDCCVAVDVTHGRTPDSPKDRTYELGGGPVAGVGPNMTRWMTERMVAKANSAKVPVQYEVIAGASGTNGWDMQIAREGIATSVLSLPLKYMHSPVETLDLSDMEAVAALLAAFVEGIGEEALA
ncbi:MAG: M42 family metallopeptidase [Oscillospiraceae bacterium]